MKILAVINAGAGANLAPGSESIEQTVAAGFSDTGISADIARVQPDEVEAATRRAVEQAKAGKADAIVVGGGDGTIRATAAMLAGSDVPLGILPLGTLNHFAKDIGIPLKLEEAIQTIAGRHLAHVDVGEVNGQTFINNSSIGIYPYMVLDRERRQKLHGTSKWTAMTFALLRVMRSFPRRQITVRAEGALETVRTPCLFVGNNQYGTNVLSLGKRDRLDAGELWLYVARIANPRDFLLLIARLAYGSIDASRDLTVLKVKAAEVSLEVSRLPVALDGEVEILETPLRYRIRPKALAVFVPKPADG